MTDVWRARRVRAAGLASRIPHAEGILVFYLELVALQEPLHRKALGAPWLDLVRSPSPADHPLLWLHRLPPEQVVTDFRGFLDGLVPVATEVIADVSAALLGLDDDRLATLLRDTASREPVDQLARVVGFEPSAVEFCPRAFLQPVAEGLAGRAGEAPDWTAATCPWCGWPAGVGVLVDEQAVKGRRRLVCSLCSRSWPHRRSACVRCGETDAGKLVYDVSDSLPHIRIEECRTCRGYLKAVDLRVDGTAVPVVDELAAVELDLWARDEGLEKIQRNVLGL